jgi:hypothetical protein
LDFNPEYKRLMVTSANGTLMMAIDPVKKDWNWWDIGWNVHTVHAERQMVAASLFDGVVLQPKSAGPNCLRVEVTHTMPRAMIRLRAAVEADLPRLFELDQICFPAGIAYSLGEFYSGLLRSSQVFSASWPRRTRCWPGFAMAQTMLLRRVRRAHRHHRCCAQSSPPWPRTAADGAYRGCCGAGGAEAASARGCGRTTPRPR